MRKLTLGLVLILMLALALVALPACGDGEGAELEVTGLSLSPSSAGIGQTVTISVTVTNTGEEEGDTEVTATVDGDEVGTKSVTVAAGGTGTATFTYTTTAEGTYTVEADGQTKTLIVTAAPAVTFATFTHPEKGYAFDYPDDWAEVAFEDIKFGLTESQGLIDGAAELGVTVQYIVGFEATTAVAGHKANVNCASYGLPVTFPPEGFWNVQQDGFDSLFPCCPTGYVHFTDRVVSAGEARTITEDRMCWLADFTWTMCDEYVEDADPFDCTSWGQDMHSMLVIVTKGITYAMTVTTTAAAWDQYEDIFEHICLSFVSPQ
ncbi:hypothetical protein ES703_09486 [subsurface metagenome]